MPNVFSHHQLDNSFQIHYKSHYNLIKSLNFYFPFHYLKIRRNEIFRFLFDKIKTMIFEAQGLNEHIKEVF